MLAALTLSLVLSAGPVCKDPCWVDCHQKYEACQKTCRDERIKGPIDPDDPSTEGMTCPESCDFNQGACGMKCPNVDGCEEE